MIAWFQGNTYHYWTPKSWGFTCWSDGGYTIEKIQFLLWQVEVKISSQNHKVEAVMYLNCPVALGKPSAFRSSPRAECFSFDFHCLPKGWGIPLKERANARVSVGYHKAQHPLHLPTQLGQSRAPTERCPVPVFPQVLHVTTHLCRLSMCLLSSVETLKGGSSCSELLGIQSVPSWALCGGGLEGKPAQWWLMWSL